MYFYSGLARFCGKLIEEEKFEKLVSTRVNWTDHIVLLHEQNTIWHYVAIETLAEHTPKSMDSLEEM